MDQATKLRVIAKKKQEGRVPVGPRIIAVTSGKGGVGKTNVAVNLSLQLCRQGYRVGLLDADLGLANVDVALGISPRHTLQHVLFQGVPLSEAVMKGPLGLMVIPGASGSREMADLNQDLLINLISDWKNFTADLDFLLVDTAAGISSSVTTFIHTCDEVIVVCTPDPFSITDAYSMIKIIGQSSLYLVINRSHDRKKSRSVAERMIRTTREYLDIELECLGTIPEDPRVSRAINRRSPLVLEYPNSGASRALGEISESLLKDKEETEDKNSGGFIYRLIGFFQQ